MSHRRWDMIDHIYAYWNGWQEITSLGTIKLMRLLDAIWKRYNFLHTFFSRQMVDCNSAEWCVLAYLHELSSPKSESQISSLRGREIVEKLNNVFSIQAKPSVSTCKFTDRSFGKDYIDNPKKKIDPLMVQLLTEYPQNQVTISKFFDSIESSLIKRHIFFFTV